MLPKSPARMQRLFPQRKIIRWQAHDYRAPGAYFVTIDATERGCPFGTVTGYEDDARVDLNALGVLLQSCWSAIPQHFSYVSLDDAFVVMPDHLHGILHLHPHGDLSMPCAPATFGPQKDTLGVVVGQFKAAVTRLAKADGLVNKWQRSFWDRVVRDEAEYRRIQQYIFDNPRRWQRTRGTQ